MNIFLYFQNNECIYKTFNIFHVLIRRIVLILSKFDTLYDIKAQKRSAGSKQTTATSTTKPLQILL